MDKFNIGIWYQSACSGVWYRRKESAGEICAIRTDSKTEYQPDPAAKQIEQVKKTLKGIIV